MVEAPRARVAEVDIARLAQEQEVARIAAEEVDRTRLLAQEQEAARIEDARIAREQEAEIIETATIEEIPLSPPPPPPPQEGGMHHNKQLPQLQPQTQLMTMQDMLRGAKLKKITVEKQVDKKNSLMERIEQFVEEEDVISSDFAVDQTQQQMADVDPMSYSLKM